jgi:ferrochelatase
MARTGILILSTGAPEDLEGVAPFLEALTGARPDEETVLRSRRSLLAIGGSSPLAATAGRIARGLECSLNGLPAPAKSEDTEETLLTMPGVSETAPSEPVDIPVLVGFSAIAPKVVEAVRRLHELGCDRVVSVPLSPLDPPEARAPGRSAARAATAELGMEFLEAPDFLGFDVPVRAATEESQRAVEELFPKYKPLVVFVAPAASAAHAGEGGHFRRVEAAVSRIADGIGMGAPDPVALEALLGVNAYGGAGVAAPWILAYLRGDASAPDAVGPFVDEIVSAAVAARGVKAIAILPIGYTVDDIPTLFGLDIECADVVLQGDMEFTRARVPNGSPALIAAMERAVREVL